MSELHYDDEWMRGVLAEVKTIALVGASHKTVRPSNGVMGYLQDKGYRVIPVNPGLAGQELRGEKVYANLKDIPYNFDMVDIFRNSEAAGVVCDEAVSLKEEKKIKVIWMQLDIRHDEAAARAEDVGLKVVMDRCPAIEYPRLIG